MRAWLSFEKCCKSTLSTRWQEENASSPAFWGLTQSSTNDAFMTSP